MKNNILIVLAIIITMLTISAKDADAQCPAGYSQTTITMNIFGCDYNVLICYKCPTLFPTYEIMLAGVMPIPSNPSCSNGLTFDQICNEIENQIATADFVYTFLCPQMQAEPCPDNSTTIIYSTPVCWNITKIIYQGAETYSYSPCNGSPNCEIIYKVCFNGTTYERTFDNATLTGGSINCYLHAYEITLPTVLNQPTDCFIINSKCTP